MPAALLILLACFVFVFTVIPAHDIQSIEQFFDIFISYVMGAGCLVAAIAIAGIYLYVWSENRKDAKEEKEKAKLASSK
ncbi:hypothetical protein [Pseudomonas sp. PLB05]|uniref:hypothetical protein n=1 Tax=Pseudomonas sp. PLB05 TaxID=2899078 RepID=UPI001E45E153|nr:hypothetical protein [Pseudomonas sp. PLB05]MCD4866948.1 hypothetical protein [Pseudomonas sp. PLB05]